MRTPRSFRRPSLPWFLTEVPAATTEDIARPRIAALLEEALEDAPLAIVSSPPGFGGTTALAQWARARGTVSWVSAASLPASATTDSCGLLRSGLLGLVPRGRPGRVGPGPGTPTLIVDDAHLLDPAAIRRTLCAGTLLSSRALRVVLSGLPVLERTFSREIVRGEATRMGAAEPRRRPSSPTSSRAPPSRRCRKASAASSCG